MSRLNSYKSRNINTVSLGLMAASFADDDFPEQIPIIYNVKISNLNNYRLNYLSKIV